MPLDPFGPDPFYASQVKAGEWRSRDGLWRFVKERSTWYGYYGEIEKPVRSSSTLKDLVREAQGDSDVERFKRRLGVR